ncbi:polysaccharide deacetylase family protein [Fulvivirga sediminis]|uniref:Polysaccharide deacetylase family protein n=1 Tax=Fulvivirga sediminis TaxID=2803949 RepID=A0A937F7Y1_9BACT|nr:polysaccharide deacetylase family protein [Fulvivirga sediminis]MBL3655723.1 polysaccharide deacetylase family protein [Fulvivirga sediminis]
MTERKYFPIKNHIYQLILFLIVVAGCAGPSGKQVEAQGIANGRKSITCFVYHRFGDEKYPSTNVDVSTFEKHIQYLKDEEFEILTLSNAIEYLKYSSKERKIAVITVDDGYKSFQTGAMPILKKHGVSATLFVNTETVGGSSYMTWEGIKEVMDQGIEIGNHSHSHGYFLNYEETIRYKHFQSDVAQAQKLFKQHLSLTPTVFAYPYGEYDKEMESIIKEMGFIGAVAQNSGVMNSSSDFYAIPRFPMASSYASLNGFKEKAKMQTLFVQSEVPDKHLLKNGNPPELKVAFKSEDLQINNLQCFIQGGECDMKVVKTDSIVEISVKSKEILKRRRTLYTLTVPSKDGAWHWFSHLWVMPSIKE